MDKKENPSELSDLSYAYVIGIDLGTTNSAVAYIDLTSKPDARGKRPIRFFEIPQLVSAGEIVMRPVLPSFLYLPGPYELPEGSTKLPWDTDRNFVIAEFAREQGAFVPNRLVSSAKSWLCHAGVDRTAPILPWGSEGDIPKVSPVEASARYLQHIREAWDALMSYGSEELEFAQQLIVLTVPASFDEVARELTIAAAQEAGIPRMVLLEEPLSAFYAWLSKNEDNWQEEMKEGQLILVCDVGGGTTDFSIIGIKAGEKGLRFNRLAVGEHLMLGGDNMDLALGRYLEKRLVGQPGKLDSRRWHQLVHQCRKAKEMLLGAPEAQAKMDITVMGTAGKLIADTLKTSLSQDEIRELIIDGFFPDCGLDETPVEGRRRGLTELGLPYVQDPAITHHLTAFWNRFEKLLREETGREMPYPDFVLFNGGALSPQIIRQHLKKIIGNWFANVAGEGWQPGELENLRPDLSVAIGASYYGLVRLGEGVRVGSGSPRTYYIEVGTGEAIKAKTAVCIVPRGTEEGFEVQMEQPAFELLTNQPVVFQLFSSSTRLGDTLGEIVQLAPDEITTLPQIRTVLRYGKKREARKLPVQIVVRLTEVGTLELWCQSRETPHRWQLQFDVRQDTEVQEELQLAGETIEVELIEKAGNLIRATFQGGEEGGTRPPERLTKNLQEFLEMKKEKWPTPLIRKMADTLLEYTDGRGLSAPHEARWLNLLGYCMRPGYGAPVDDWRMKQIWRLYLQGLKFPKQDQVRSEWWIFWRRVAGGLTAGRQQQIYQQVLPLLQNVGSQKGKSKKAAKRLNPQEELEIRMMTSNFERLPAEAKIELGRLLLQKIRNSKPKNQELWTIGRLGARVPMYGPLDRLIPSEEVMGWIHSLLSLPIEINDAYAHTLVQLSRLTGDRTRDIPEELRNEVAERLKQLQKGDYFIELLINPDSASRKEEQEWAFGESLPAGFIVELNTP